MVNPYIVGKPVPSYHLYGRDELIEKCYQNMNNNIWLLGRRRSGKTSVLYAIEKFALARKEWFPVYITLEDCFSDSDIKKSFLRGFQNNLKKIELEEEYQPPDETYDFVDLVDDVCRWLNNHEIGLLLLLDEIEQLEGEEFEEGGRLEAKLRGIHGRSELRLRTIISASRILCTRKSLVTSPFIGLFKIEYIGSIFRAKARKLILQEKNDEVEIKATAEVIDEILEKTACEPYLCQYLCDRLYQRDNSLRTPKDADFTQLDRNLVVILASDYGYLEKEEQKILYTIAQGKQTTVSSVPTELIRLEYVRPVNAHYTIGNHFLGIWLQGKPNRNTEAQPDVLMTANDILQRKIKSGEFDVFLCHNSADKPAVKEIGERLKKQGILPWLDEWELPPGQPWQRLLEQQIEQVKSVAVFVGGKGIRPWQQEELEAFLRQFVKRGCPVIPVVLKDAPEKPALPIFLEGRTWVDFRKDEPEPMKRLIWGITGKRTA